MQREPKTHRKTPWSPMVAPKASNPPSTLRALAKPGLDATGRA